MGDFNAEVSETSFPSFCKLFSSKKHYEPVDLLQKPYKLIVTAMKSYSSKPVVNEARLTG